MKIQASESSNGKKRSAYRWGDVMNFIKGGNGASYCTDGWGQAEEGITWTISPNARLAMSVAPPKSDVSLILSCIPFVVEGKLARQELHVYVNFLRIGFALVPEPSEIEIRIPAKIITGPDVDIDLYMPHACSPASLGTGADIRDLGIAVNRVMLIQS
jgi:hypothetical protein